MNNGFMDYWYLSGAGATAGSLSAGTGPSGASGSQISPGAGAAMGIASVVGAIGNAYLSSRTQKIQAKWNAEIAKQNQLMAENSAQMALRAAAINVGNISRQAQQVKAGQKVAMAANGISSGAGTYAEVLTTTDIYKEENIREARISGYQQAWNYRIQGLNAVAQAGAYSSIAASSKPAAAGLLQGLTTGAYNYAMFTSKGFA